MAFGAWQAGLRARAAASPDFLVSFPGLGIYDLPVNRTAFELGPLEIRWYGLVIGLATLLVFVLAIRHRRPYGLTEDVLYDGFLAIIPGMLVGARAYYVIFSWDQYRDNLGAIFNLRQGGMAFYGGLIGACIALWILSRVTQRSFWVYADYFAPYVPLAQGLGRWGNFFNQEAFGYNTTLPWGMISNGTRDYLEQLGNPAWDPNVPVHPTFLYEFLGNMVIAAVLFSIRRKSPARGQVAMAYLGLYGLLRFGVEGLRTDALYIGSTNLMVSQLLSALMVLAAVVYCLYLRRHRLAGQPVAPAFPAAGREPEAVTEPAGPSD